MTTSWELLWREFRGRVGLFMGGENQSHVAKQLDEEFHRVSLFAAPIFGSRMHAYIQKAHPGANPDNVGRIFFVYYHPREFRLLYDRGDLKGANHSTENMFQFGCTSPGDTRIVLLTIAELAKSMAWPLYKVPADYITAAGWNLLRGSGKPRIGLRRYHKKPRAERDPDVIDVAKGATSICRPLSMSSLQEKLASASNNWERVSVVEHQLMIRTPQPTDRSRIVSSSNLHRLLRLIRAETLTGTRLTLDDLPHDLRVLSQPPDFSRGPRYIKDLLWRFGDAFVNVRQARGLPPIPGFPPKTGLANFSAVNIAMMHDPCTDFFASDLYPLVIIAREAASRSPDFIKHEYTRFFAIEYTKDLKSRGLVVRSALALRPLTSNFALQLDDPQQPKTAPVVLRPVSLEDARRNFPVPERKWGVEQRRMLQPFNFQEDIAESTFEGKYKKYLGWHDRQYNTGLVIQHSGTSARRMLGYDDPYYWSNDAKHRLLTNGKTIYAGVRKVPLKRGLRFRDSVESSYARYIRNCIDAGNVTTANMLKNDLAQFLGDPDEWVRILESRLLPAHRRGFESQRNRMANGEFFRGWSANA